jgi:hypothetical protein
MGDTLDLGTWKGPNMECRFRRIKRQDFPKQVSGQEDDSVVVVLSVFKSDPYSVIPRTSGG